VPWSWKSTGKPLPTLWATTGPITGTIYLYIYIYIHTYIHTHVSNRPLILQVIHNRIYFLLQVSSELILQAVGNGDRLKVSWRYASIFTLMNLFFFCGGGGLNTTTLDYYRNCLIAVWRISVCRRTHKTSV